jgi:hypothetical protein
MADKSAFAGFTPIETCQTRLPVPSLRLKMQGAAPPEFRQNKRMEDMR